MKRKLIAAALLLLVALPMARFLREENGVHRSTHHIFDAIQIGMPIKELQVFSTDAPDGPGRTEFVICTAQKDAPLLHRDNWWNLAKSESGFPPACRTMEVWIRGGTMGPGDELFDLEFDESWKVSKIGGMRTNLRG